MNNNKINKSLPLILNLKIYIARLAIIWENLASYLFNKVCIEKLS